MKFSGEKKHAIMTYIIEKVADNTPNLTKQVADTFNISRNTVNVYVNELQNRQIIRKLKKNQYQLITETYNYQLHRSNGDLDSDTYALEKYFQQYIADCTPEARSIWNYAMSEMLNNVMDHSGADNLNMYIRKDFLNTTVILIDDGVGIFEKIKKYFNFESLEEARCELFKGKLTTDDKNHSGEGIFFTSRMLDEFLILSSGLMFSTNKYNSEHTLNMPNNIHKGTGVFMALSNNTHRQISDIFDMYSDVDHGFDKTTIPLKNIFDDAPVSRSQAKRICNRLDKFAEVILDFADLDWMGQAFAHQLFVVYQNEHPKIELKPINMSEPVRKMYLHVKNT